MRLGRQSPGLESDGICFFFQTGFSPFQKKLSAYICLHMFWLSCHVVELFFKH